MKNKETKSIFSSLENFSSTPPSELWDKIEAQLDQPKKKKRPVVWWWVAATLMAGLMIPSILYVNSNQNKILELRIENNADGVVLQKDTNQDVNVSKKDLIVLDQNSNNSDASKNIIVKTEVDKKEALNESNVTKSNAHQNINYLVNSNSVATTISSKLANSKKSSTSLTTVKLAEKTTNNSNLTNSNNEKDSQSIVNIKNKSQLDAVVVNEKVAVNNYENTPANKKNSRFEKGKIIQNNEPILVTEKTSVIVLNQNKESFAKANSKSIPNTQNTSISELNKNKSIAENDSLKEIKKEVAQLETTLAELDKDKIKKKKTSEVIDKWSLQVFAGVMSSDNFSNEKTLGNTVASKQSSGYGVKTNYKLNKKWAVSSGFKINELGQKIEGVSYYERNASYSSISGILPPMADISPLNSASKSNVIVFASTNENYLFASKAVSDSGFETGNVTQNLKYFEMPVEISYAILSKKKMYISMNTGGFVGKLISNDVLLNGSLIGENNDVNEFVYGTLLSSTLQYEFYKKTKFFIEPGMNYYINPLENQSFNQFQWMFNVGINVSF